MSLPLGTDILGDMNSPDKIETGTPSHPLLTPRHLMACLLVALVLLLHLGAGISLWAPSSFDTYTRQAMAWRQGLAHLPEDVPHLELAIYQGEFFVSFPPVPSVMLLPFTFLWGDQVPDAVLMLLYALVAFYAVCRALDRRGWPRWQGSIASFLLCTASAMLPMLLTGAVWYHAQVLAFALTVLAIERMDAGKPFSGLVCYALSVGCRPFNALYGPLLMAFYLFSPGERAPGHIKRRLKAMAPGVLAGLAVAFLYGWYNWHRFGNPLEFGHNHLPEFSFQGGQQFSLSHISSNARTFLMGWPWVNENGSWHFHPFGFSLFVANPVFLCMLAWSVLDIANLRFSWREGAVLVLCCAHVFLLLSHRTFGGFQYGARYAVDCIPYALLYLLGRRHQKKLGPAALALLGLGLVLAVWGSLTITLPA